MNADDEMGTIENVQFKKAVKVNGFKQRLTKNSCTKLIPKMFQSVRTMVLVTMLDQVGDANVQNFGPEENARPMLMNVKYQLKPVCVVTMEIAKIRQVASSVLVTMGGKVIHVTKILMSVSKRMFVKLITSFV